MMHMRLRAAVGAATMLLAAAGVVGATAAPAAAQYHVDCAMVNRNIETAYEMRNAALEAGNTGAAIVWERTGAYWIAVADAHGC